MHKPEQPNCYSGGILPLTMSAKNEYGVEVLMKYILWCYICNKQMTPSKALGSTAVRIPLYVKSSYEWMNG